MRRQALDVIQVDDAMDNRNAADWIVLLAQERAVAVMIRLPSARAVVRSPAAPAAARLGARDQRRQLGAGFPQ